MTTQRFFADGGEPFLVFRVLCEMIVVDLNPQIRSAKNAGHFVAAKLPIEEEGYFLRLLLRDRVRSGSLLQSFPERSRNPSRVHRLIHLL